MSRSYCSLGRVFRYSVILLLNFTSRLYLSSAGARVTLWYSFFLILREPLKVSGRVLDMPKSQMNTLQWLSMSILAGLMSRWITLALWMYLRALKALYSITFTCSSDRSCDKLRKDLRSCSWYDVTRKMWSRSPTVDSEIPFGRMTSSNLMVYRLFSDSDSLRSRVISLSTFRAV